MKSTRQTLRPRLSLLWRLSLCGWFLLTGCGQQAAPEVSSGVSAEISSKTQAEQVRRPLSLPGLEGLDPAARAQLQDQYAYVQALSDRQEADTTVGKAYGEFGQLLLAYEYDDDAEPALLNAGTLIPNDVRWPYYLGYLYQRATRLEAAARWYERVLALQPEDVPTHIRLAEVYRDLGREAEAATLLQEATRLDPRCVQAYFLLGQIAGASSKAIPYYEKVLQLQPDASVAHYPLGLAYRNQGNLERSRYHLDRRGETQAKIRDVLLEDLERLKKGANATMYVARNFMVQRKFREAAMLFGQVVEEDPENTSGYLNLGAALGQLGRVDEAMEAFKQALRLDPSESKAHYNLAVIYGARGEPDRALDHFRAAVEADPNYSEAHFGLTRILWRRRQCREALPHFQAFLRVSPEHVEARLHQAICHVELGEYAQARALLEIGYEASPEHPGLRDALVRVLAASADDRVRDGQRALELAEPLAAELRRPETLESLAMAYAETGRFPEAIQHQQDAIRALDQYGLNAWFDHMNDNLRRYEQGQPCRTPWAAVIFE